LNREQKRGRGLNSVRLGWVDSWREVVLGLSMKERKGQERGTALYSVGDEWVCVCV